MAGEIPKTQGGFALSLPDLRLFNELVGTSPNAAASCDQKALSTNIAEMTKNLETTNCKAFCGSSQLELELLKDLLTSTYPEKDRPDSASYLIGRINNGIEKFVKGAVIADTPPIYSDRPFHAFANIGDEDNLISVKRFASQTDAQAWIKQLEIERPAYYTVIHESEF